jgi:hypothetical protein
MFGPESFQTIGISLYQVSLIFNKERINDVPDDIPEVEPELHPEEDERTQEHQPPAEPPEPHDHDMSVVTMSLKNVLRFPERDVPIYEVLVVRINTVVTHAYEFARYVFVGEYNENDDFTVDEYVTDAFFRETLKAMMEWTYHAPRTLHTARSSMPTIDKPVSRGISGLLALHTHCNTGAHITFIRVACNTNVGSI